MTESALPIPLGELEEKARFNYRERRPFVLYRKPGENNVYGLFQENENSHFVEDYSETGYVFAPFQGPALYIPFSEGKFYLSELTEPGKRQEMRFSTIDDDSEQSRYKALVNDAVSAIRGGGYDKIVLSRRQGLAINDFDYYGQFLKLSELYPNACSYCWYHPQTGFWVGAFAERLLKLAGNVLSTMSLAGTLKWPETGEPQWTTKEASEQQYVTDFISGALEPFSRDIQISDRKTIRAGQLAHLMTDITATARQDSFKLSDLVAALHPTPAVCGLPKAAAQSYILNNEGYDRKYYAGFHGELNRKADEKLYTELFVNLRCMNVYVAENGSFEGSLYVGGGITADSDAEREWLETVHKAGTILKSLGEKI